MIVITKSESGKNKSLPQWFKEDQKVDISINQIEELLSSGNNINLIRSSGDDVVAVLFVK